MQPQRNRATICRCVRFAGSVRAIGGVWALLALSGCVAESLPIKKVYQAERCAITDQTLRLVASQDELRKLTAPSFIPAGNDSAGTAAKESAPAVDFDDEWVTVAAWGRKPNSGYRIELTGETAAIVEQVARLPIEFAEPEPDGVYAQVMVAPCLITAVPKGDYKIIVANKLRLDLPGK